MSNWKDTSEQVSGLVLRGYLSADAVNPDLLYPPYNQIVILKRKGLSESDMIVKSIPWQALQGAIAAGEHVAKKEGWDAFDYVHILETFASRAINGAIIRKEADKLENGDEADIGIILQSAAKLENGYYQMTPMSDVNPAEGIWVETGYEPIDKHIGGLPNANMTILAASPGVGKTSLGLRIAISMVKKYPHKKVAIFTLEMLMSHLTKRALEIEKLKKSEKERIILCDEILSAQEVYALASRAAASDDLSLILIDFADQMVDGEQSESMMGIIYRSIATLAKRTEVPVLLISQLNRETYSSGLPRINHIRYSGLAEANSALILLVHNPHNIFVDKKANDQLPSIAGVGYLIAGKSRFGYKEGCVGAVQIEWDGLAGWGTEAMAWHSLG